MASLVTLTLTPPSARLALLWAQRLPPLADLLIGHADRALMPDPHAALMQRLWHLPGWDEDAPALHVRPVRWGRHGSGGRVWWESTDLDLIIRRRGGRGGGYELDFDTPAPPPLRPMTFAQLRDAKRAALRLQTC